MNEDLNVRFSDDHYATKSEVSKELKSNLIDPIYQNILNYRSKYRKNLFIKNYTGLFFNICWLNSVNEKVINFSDKFDKEFNNFMINSDKKSSSEYKISQLKNIFYNFKNFYKDKNFDDNFITSVIYSPNFKYDGSSKTKIKMTRYMKCLNYLRVNTDAALDEDFLINLYSLYSEKELVSLYRNKDFFNPYEVSAVNPVYKGASFERIPSLMESFIEFLSKNEYNEITKAIVCFFYINYVKPFEDNNEEISLLLFKFILSKKYHEFALFFYPFENLLSHFSEFENSFNEGCKNLDLTYFLLKAIEILNGESNDEKESRETIIPQVSEKKKTENSFQNDLLDGIDQEKFSSTQTAFHEKENITAFKNDDNNKSQTNLNENNISTSSSNNTNGRTEILSFSDVEGKPYTPKETSIKQSSLEDSETKINKEQNSSNLSFETIAKAPSMISKRKSPNTSYNKEDNAQSKDLMHFLIETNPNLHKAQAKFLSSHCTMNRYYTIEDYKKYIGCVYETARTSMDGLAELGYYKKEQIKNKFVFSLISEIKEF